MFWAIYCYFFSSRNACCIFQSGDCILRRFFNITANFVVVYFCLLVSCIGKWKRVRCFNIGLVIYPRQRLYAPDSPGSLKANDRAMFECCRDSLPNGSYSSYSPTATFAPTGTCWISMSRGGCRLAFFSCQISCILHFLNVICLWKLVFGISKFCYRFTSRLVRPVIWHIM